jgi:hypothetical protein
MHKDIPDIPVRTFEALKCALNRIEDYPDKEIVLVAHDAQNPQKVLLAAPF